MSQATLPWIERGPLESARLRIKGQLVLGLGAAAQLGMAAFLGVPLLFMPEQARSVVFPVTVTGPALGGIALAVTFALLAARGFIRRSKLLVGVSILAGVGASAVNYVILGRLGFDAYVFGVLTLLVAPALGGVTFLAGFVAVLAYRRVGRVLRRFALAILLAFVAVGLIGVPWAHALLFRYVDALAANPVVNVDGDGVVLLTPAEVRGPLSIAELTSEAAGWTGRLRVVGYALFPLQFAVVRDVLGLGAVLGFINLIPLFGIWWERKVAGRIQSRLGPMRVGGWHGWAQSFADGIKLIFKEDFVPPQGDAALFRLSPYLAFVPVVVAFLGLPFGTYWVFRNLDVALVFILAMLGIEVVGVILAGWASNNKWAVYGSMREACQMVSYEIPMGMALLVPVMTAGTLNLSHIVDGGEGGFAGQGGGFWNWLMFANPFCFAAGVLYYIASLASCKRAPFDLPESESELVAGFHTEFSGFRWSLFFFAEYAAMYVVCGLCVILFLGGWHSPLPGTWRLAGDGLLAQGVNGLLHSGPLWFVFKSGLLLYVQLWIRWTLPRIRIDQVLYSCIQVMLPATMLVLLGNTFWLLVEAQGYGWFAAVAGVVRWVLALGGVTVLLVCLYWIVHGYLNNRRLVGTLAIDHLPGA